VVVETRRYAVPDRAYAALRERLADVTGVVMLIGASETGKTTLAKLLVLDAIDAGRSVAYVDGDVASVVAGPPGCVGLKYVESAADLDPQVAAAEMRFVGSISPQGVVLPHVVAVGSLVELARQRAELVILDTSSVVGGVVGQTLKYHLWELAQPALGVALQRGEELEPIIAMLRRFLSAKIATVAPPSDAPLPSPTERHARQAAAFRDALSAPLQRWRVQTTVFAPTLPEEFDLDRLDGMLVGVQDDEGRCLGLGVIESVDGVLRVATHYGEAMRGLRLGSLRVDLETFDTQRVRLRQLIFGI
jgi:polynucleotide 5'-kinase involved in rRNA processing